MKFFFPDSQDLVDPSFDFDRETRNEQRYRQRDDLYAHEVFHPSPYDGILISKAIVEGNGGGGGRFTVPQRHRLFRSGGSAFFRLQRPDGRRLLLMADCGAFSYIKDAVPPFSVDNVLSFYETIGCDYGVSVDHVILDYQPDWDRGLFGIGGGAPPAVRRRREVTLELAEEFFRACRANGVGFTPMGVAQGWSPGSYRASVESLQRMGYSYIALGGLVPLKTREILEVLEAVGEVRRENTSLHLLGITRLEAVPRFANYGAVSFDSTSPLRQAFKDSKDNYYTLDGTYVAVRVPQVDGNTRLLKAIQAGHVVQQRAQALEKECLQALKAYEGGLLRLESLLDLLHDYEQLLEAGRDNRAAYAKVLEARPWRQCPCAVCQELGYHVILFRGAERNRRRGFHNVWITRQRLNQHLEAVGEAMTGETQRASP